MQKKFVRRIGNPGTPLFGICPTIQSWIFLNWTRCKSCSIVQPSTEGYLWMMQCYRGQTLSTTWWEQPVALMSDIEAMFHQVRVPPEDRDVLRFLWWKDEDFNKEPLVYRMCVHLFGGTWSPRACSYALKKENMTRTCKLNRTCSVSGCNRKHSKVLHLTRQPSQTDSKESQRDIGESTSDARNSQTPSETEATKLITRYPLK